MSTALALEKHYRVKDLVALWGFSRDTIIREVKNEAGVIAIGNKKRRLSIPESVAVRVHERLGNQSHRVAPNRKPLRVIRLRDMIPQRTRRVIKARAAQ